MHSTVVAKRSESARCHADQADLLGILVNGFGKDERLKIILTELIPYSDRESIDRAQKFRAKIANGNEAYVSLTQWLKEYVRKPD